MQCCIVIYHTEGIYHHHYVQRVQTCWGSGPCLVYPTIPLLLLSINFYQFLVHGHGQREQIHSSSLLSSPEMMSGGGGGLSSSGEGFRRSNLIGCISPCFSTQVHPSPFVGLFHNIHLSASFSFLFMLSHSFSSLFSLDPGSRPKHPSLTLASLSPVLAGVHLTRRVAPLSENNAGPLTAAG